jgi:uncharacterized protein (DUF433 family)
MALAARRTDPTPTSHPHIVRAEGVCGGRPHIRGTRISVRTIAELFRSGEPAAAIAAAYQQVEPAAVYDAISYYLDHKPEIEAEIEANTLDAALEKTDAELGKDGVIRFRDGSG